MSYKYEPALPPEEDLSKNFGVLKSQEQFWESFQGSEGRKAAQTADLEDQMQDQAWTTLGKLYCLYLA